MYTHPLCLVVGCWNGVLVVRLSYILVWPHAFDKFSTFVIDFKQGEPVIPALTEATQEAKKKVFRGEFFFFEKF